MLDNELNLRRELEGLPSDRLRSMLNTETEKDVPDDDVVLAILHILEDREPDELVPASAKEEAAWKLYRKRVRARRRKSHLGRNSLANAAVLILVVGLLVAVVPQQAEAESLWDVLVRWVNGTIEFFDPEEITVDSPFVFVTENAALQQIYDAALEMGIEQPLIPMWFPEGYTLDGISKTNTPQESFFSARIVKETKAAIFQVKISDKEVLHGFFGEKEWYKQFEREGAEYKTMRNINRWTAMWKIDKIEYSITIDCQEDTLQRILDSIYVMEE